MNGPENTVSRRSPLQPKPLLVSDKAPADVPPSHEKEWDDAEQLAGDLMEQKKTKEDVYETNNTKVDGQKANGPSASGGEEKRASQRK